MVIGILMGIALAVFFASIGLIILGGSGVMVENLATGAVIGTSGVVSYAIITSIISFVVIFFLYLVLRRS